MNVKRNSRINWDVYVVSIPMVVWLCSFFLPTITQSSNDWFFPGTSPGIVAALDSFLFFFVFATQLSKFFRAPAHLNDLPFALSAAAALDCEFLDGGRPFYRGRPAAQKRPLVPRHALDVVTDPVADCLRQFAFEKCGEDRAGFLRLVGVVRSPGALRYRPLSALAEREDSAVSTAAKIKPPLLSCCWPIFSAVLSPTRESCARRLPALSG